MPDSRLTHLQCRILHALAGMPGGWTLTGGAALAGFHTKHRTTRDLDLFWRGKVELAGIGREAVDRLRASGFSVDVLQTASAFQRLNVRSEGETCLVDLVAEPVASVEAPRSQVLGDVTIQVDTPHEILVNKLCTLLNRSELRDLVDVEALLDAGGDLRRAMSDAPRKDGGFSPLVLAWLVKDMPVVEMARGLNWNEEQVRGIVAFREQLCERVTAAGAP